MIKKVGHVYCIYGVIRFSKNVWVKSRHGDSYVILALVRICKNEKNMKFNPLYVALEQCFLLHSRVSHQSVMWSLVRETYSLPLSPFSRPKGRGFEPHHRQSRGHCRDDGDLLRGKSVTPWVHHLPVSDHK